MPSPLNSYTRQSVFLHSTTKPRSRETTGLYAPSDERCLLRGDIRYAWSVVWDRISRCLQPALERVHPRAFHPSLPNQAGKASGCTTVFVPQADSVTHYRILAEEHRPRASEAGALAAQPLAVNRSEHHCYLRANVDEHENFLRQYILG